MLGIVGVLMGIDVLLMYSVLGLPIVMCAVFFVQMRKG